MAFKLAELFVELSTKGYTAVQSQIISVKNNLAQLASTVGGQLGISFTGAAIVGYLVHAAREAHNAEMAMRRLDAILSLSGNTSGRTATEIETLAQSLSKASNFSKDEIINASAALAQFQGVSGEGFDRALRSAVDLGSVTGDIAGAVRAVGSAMDDPINGIALLHRQFKAFRRDVAENAAALAKSGDIVGARNAIQSEIDRISGGVAQKTIDPWVTASKDLANISENIGKNLMDANKYLGSMAGNAGTLTANLSKGMESGSVSDWMMGTGGPGEAPTFSQWLMGSKNVSIAGDRAERAAARERAAKGAAANREQKTPEQINAEEMERLRSEPETAEHRMALMDQLDAKATEGALGEAKAFEAQLKQYRLSLEKDHATEDEIAPLLDRLRAKFESDQAKQRIKLMSSIDAEGATRIESESIEFNQHLEELRDQMTKAGTADEVIQQKLDAIRARHAGRKETERLVFDLGLNADTLTGVAKDLAEFNKKLVETSRSMQEQGYGLDAIREQRRKMQEKFQKDQGDKQGDVVKSLFMESAPETIKRKLEIDFNAEALRKKIDDALPAGAFRDAIIGDVEELRALKQKQDQLDQQKAPEFVGLVEMSKKIQSMVAGEGKQALEKRQVDLLQRIKDRAEGSGLNFNLGPESLRAIKDAMTLG